MHESYDGLPKQAVPIKDYYVAADGRLHVKIYDRYIRAEYPSGSKDIKYRIYMGNRVGIRKETQMERVLAGHLLTRSAAPGQALEMFRNTAIANLTESEKAFRAAKKMYERAMAASAGECVTDSIMDPSPALAAEESQ